MFTICCTAKLLKRIRFLPEPTIEEPTTALGNWHANLLYINRSQFILFVNDDSRLAVITPAKDARSMAGHLSRHLSALLHRLKVPSYWIDAEIREMADANFAKTRSRSVLGTMNEYKLQIEASLYMTRTLDLIELENYMNEVIAGPLNYRQPDEVALELLHRRYAK
jgi:hypothetical protein